MLLLLLDAAVLATASLWLSIPAAIISFIACYLLCYVVHEWGHYLGARLSGITMPLLPYKGFLLGQFQIEQYSRRQYLWLSWGGDLGHVFVTLIATWMFLFSPGLVTGAFCLGGVGFTVQALAVDQPIIWKVTAGADIKETAAAGTHPTVILRRTWQTWLGTAGVISLWYFLA